VSDVFIDTNVLLRVFNEEAGFEDAIEDIAEIKSSGHELNISCITHFELLWGYYLYAEGDDFLKKYENVRNGDDFLEKYENVRNVLEIEIVDFTKRDVEVAAMHCRSKNQIRDYFIGSTVKNRSGILLTYNLVDFTWVENVCTPHQFLIGKKDVG
jgi:predicted nucleic acid-binding protein